MEILVDQIQIRPEVAEKLCYYVYAYVDPRNSEIFCVGKGCGARVLSHLDEIGQSEKIRRIAELKSVNLQPQIDILAHGIKTEETALRIEAAVIDALRPPTNIVRGFQTLEFGRVPLAELEFLYAAKPITIDEPVLLIRINQLYRPGMDSESLYEATRGVWTCGTRRENAHFAFAVYQGVVREVYEIEKWYKAGTLEYRTRSRDDVDVPNRCEFSGKVSEKLSAKYKGGSVGRFFSKGAQLPYTYVNC